MGGGDLIPANVDTRGSGQCPDLWSAVVEMAHGQDGHRASMLKQVRKRA
jgi:hypothetical protein